MSEFELNTKQTEAANLNEVSSKLIELGFMVYRPEADIGGVDFILMEPSGQFLRCQLKSRAFVQKDKYGSKGIVMVFPGQGQRFERDWYLVPHDTLFEILKSKHGHAPKWDHPKFGEYWHCPVSSDLANILAPFLLKNSLEKRWLDVNSIPRDCRNNWKDLVEYMADFDGYSLLPESDNVDILVALEHTYLSNGFSTAISEITLKLILFWRLRQINLSGWGATQEDYDMIDRILADLRTVDQSAS